MRLGFHYHVPAALADGLIRTPGYQGRFVDALANHCSEVVCFLHTPVGHELHQMDYALRKENVRLVNLGPHVSVPNRLLSALTYASVLRGQRTSLDALLLRGPSPLLPTLAKAIRPVATALLLVGDAGALVDDSEQPFWRREAIRLLWRWNRHRQDQAAKKSLTFVNSRMLFLEMLPFVPNLVETRTTTLTQADFFDREDTCMRSPCRLLYSGRMTRGKGLPDMVEALGLLVRSGEDVVLDLVGWPEKGENVLDEVMELAEDLQVAERVKFHGPKAVGPELFAHYRNADIFLVASRSSEGFPRTIWEAMAHSVPVVATGVGSIPHFVGQAATIVQPNDAQRLADAVKAVLHDASRRREMIRAGRQLASTVTLEQQVVGMLAHIESWIHSGNLSRALISSASVPSRNGNSTARIAKSE